jgi:hypothetical protein
LLRSQSGVAMSLAPSDRRARAAGSGLNFAGCRALVRQLSKAHALGSLAVWDGFLWSRTVALAALVNPFPVREDTCREGGHTGSSVSLCTVLIFLIFLIFLAFAYL